MSTGIGGITLHSLRGAPDMPAMELERLRRPNVDGAAYREIGRRARPYILEGKIDIASGALVHSFRLASKALVGTLVSIELDDTVIYNGHLLLDVDILEPVRVKVASGGTLAAGTAQYWVRSRWTLHYPLAV